MDPNLCALFLYSPVVCEEMWEGHDSFPYHTKFFLIKKKKMCATEFTPKLCIQGSLDKKEKKMCQWSREKYFNGCDLKNSSFWENLLK